MTIPSKTLSNGFSLPVYGLGTWHMGGRYETDTTNDQTDIAAIQAALDLGVTHIDTAEAYGAGHAEELIGQAIKPHARKSLTITSKVHQDHLGYDDLIVAAHRSLERLQTDYLDLYLLHRFNSTIPLEETMKAMDRLVADGLVRQIGVSNFTVERLAAAQALTKNKFVSNQLHYNLQVREVERYGLLEYCQKNDIYLVAWRPVQKGVLAESGVPILDEMAEKYEKTPAQVALNWLITQENVVTITKTSNVKHLKENLGAVGWSLSDEDVERLRNEFPEQLDRSETVPLDYA